MPLTRASLVAGGGPPLQRLSWPKGYVGGRRERQSERGLHVTPNARQLRPLLAALTNALEQREPFAEVIAIDLTTFALVIDSTLDDVDRRPPRAGWVVRAPDGLWEWEVRRDFVRGLPAGRVKSRLGNTLGGPKTRRRFEVALAAAGGSLHGAFKRLRRRRLRAYAARVLRVAVGLGSISPPETPSELPGIR